MFEPCFQENYINDCSYVLPCKFQDRAEPFRATEFGDCNMQFGRQPSSEVSHLGGNEKVERNCKTKNSIKQLYATRPPPPNPVTCIITLDLQL